MPARCGLLPRPTLASGRKNALREFGVLRGWPRLQSRGRGAMGRRWGRGMGGGRGRKQGVPGGAERRQGSGGGGGRLLLCVKGLFLRCQNTFFGDA
jgi:hypothetical protein